MTVFETVAHELCALLADERRAIAALDHARLETLALKKQELATRLGELRPERTRLVLDLVERLRIEAVATALLAATAGDAVRSILGYGTNGYDRHARLTTSPTSRLLASY